MYKLLKLQDCLLITPTEIIFLIEEDIEELSEAAVLSEAAMEAGFEEVQLITMVLLREVLALAIFRGVNQAITATTTPAIHLQVVLLLLPQ